MNSPQLTIGMAVANDYHGVWATVESLLEHHPELDDIPHEIVVVDNDPTSKHGAATAALCRGLRKRGVRYVEFDEQQGTAQPRNQVFANATSPLVLCIDPHVLLKRGSIAALLQYYEDHPQTKDMIQGPCFGLSSRQGDHQLPVWRGMAFGIWEKDPRAESPLNEPFEVFQQGMGLFSMRREAWVGFHPDMRGFGGCETYVAQKVRQNGGRVICHPGVRWIHRFNDPDGPKYVNDLMDRYRNYEIGFEALGDVEGLKELSRVFAPVLDLYREQQRDARPVGKLSVCEHGNLTIQASAIRHQSERDTHFVMDTRVWCVDCKAEFTMNGGKIRSLIEPGAPL